MKTREELEEMFRRALSEQKRKYENWAVDHPDMPAEQAARIQSDGLHNIERAEGPDFDYEFSAFVAAECSTLIENVAGTYGIIAKDAADKLKEVKDNGLWDRRGLGNRLGVSADEVIAAISSSNQGGAYKDDAIQTLYEMAGFKGHLPTGKEIDELDDSGQTFEAAFAKEISGKGKREYAISLGIYRKMAEKADPRLNEGTIANIKETVLGKEEKDGNREDDKI